MNGSDMRNGTKTRSTQLGQCVNAKAAIWKPSRKIWLCSPTVDAAEVGDLLMHVWLSVHRSSAAVHLFKWFLKGQNEEDKSSSSVLVCNITTFHILSCVKKLLSISLHFNSFHGWKNSWCSYKMHFGINLISISEASEHSSALPVSLVVHRHDVHGDVILLVRVQTCYLYPHGRKHPPERGEKQHIINAMETISFYPFTLCKLTAGNKIGPKIPAQQPSANNETCSCHMAD